jgi:hypothetical protein
MTSAELLAWCEMMSGLPDPNEEMDDAKWYLLLTQAQRELVRLLATHVPRSQVGEPELLTTPDEGYTYVLAHTPWGRVEIRETRTGRLLEPGAEYDPSADFAIEGKTIRWPNNAQRTFGDGPYARYSAEPGVINAATEPTLWPAEANVIIAWKALTTWAARGRLRDPSMYANELQNALWGDPMSPGDVGLIGALKVQFLNEGGIDGGARYPWWKSSDLTTPRL